MRHAKTEPAAAGMLDRDRQLTEGGIADARRMASHLAALSLEPALIISSAAQRTRQTATIVAEQFPLTGEIFFYNELYQSNVLAYVKILNELASMDASPLLLVGHNPEIESFVATAGNLENPEFKPGCVAHIEFAIDSWKELRPRSRGVLRGLWRPKELD